MRWVPTIVMVMVMVMTTMATSRADERDPARQPARWRATTSLVGGSLTLGGRETAHGSLELELARRAGVLAPLVTAQVGWVDATAADDMSPLARLDGARLHAGFGGRWFARSTEIDRSAHFEFYFDAAIGVEVLAWRQTAPTWRPDLAIGWGLQVDGPIGPVEAIRIGLVLLAAPPVDDPAATAMCDAACVASAERPVESGFMSRFGVSW